MTPEIANPATVSVSGEVRSVNRAMRLDLSSAALISSEVRPLICSSIVNALTMVMPCTVSCMAESTRLLRSIDSRVALLSRLEM